jgi:disulfide bond formation protein DsbB
MTINLPDQPRPQAGYNPITLDDLKRTICPAFPESSGGLKNPVSRCLAAPLFLLIFVYVQKIPPLWPLLVLGLLGCLVWRMDGHVRRIAAVPLTLSAIKLSTEMASHLNASRVNAANPQGLAFEPGVFWLPIFLAACLVFIPNKESVTFRIIFVASCLLLATGLLPGDGFLVIFYVLGVMLFLAMGIGIFVDVTNHLQRPPQAGSLTAR